jgi:hypothetical protein
VKRRILGAIALVSMLAAGAAVTPARAQSPPPVTGFVPGYEIGRIVHDAGFTLLAPPMRQGRVYVVRARDIRGAPMRIVVDARTGVIRDVTPIVPGPGSYAAAGMPPYYPAPGYYAPPPGYPPRPIERPGMPPSAPAMNGSAALGAPHAPPAFATVHETVFPPLPRPRPAELAARRAGEEAAPAVRPALTSDAKPPAAATAPRKPYPQIND